MISLMYVHCPLFLSKKNPEFTLRASCSRIRPLESTVILYLDSIHHDILLWFFNMVSLLFSFILLIQAIQLTLIKSPSFFCKLLIMISPLNPENCFHLDLCLEIEYVSDLSFFVCLFWKKQHLCQKWTYEYLFSLWDVNLISIC